MALTATTLSLTLLRHRLLRPLRLGFLYQTRSMLVIRIDLVYF